MIESFENNGDPLPDTQLPAPTETKSPPLRVVMLVDDSSLKVYGPVMRRLSVGLIDEVRDLSLLSPQPSPLLEYVPCPPVRIFTETRQFFLERPRHEEDTSRKITIQSPRFAFIDRLFPDARINRIAKELAEYKPTLLHAMGERQTWLAARLARKLAIPYVVSLLTFNKVSIDITDPWCHGVLPCNSLLARQIRKNFPKLAHRVHFAPIGTHIAESPCAFDNVEYKPCIFCCAPFRKNRGHDHLIEALRILGEMGQHPFLTFSGEGPLEYALRRQADKAGLLTQIQFVPPIEKMTSLDNAYKGVLAGGDIYVQPWPANSWRTALLEALSVGMAVAVAAGQPADLRVEEKTVIHFPFADPQGMAKVLYRLLTDVEFSKKLAASAQTYLRKHFLASKMVSDLTKAYRLALAITPNFPRNIDEDE